MLRIKGIVAIALFTTVILGGCARGLTPFEAANGKQKCVNSYVK